MTNKIYMYLVDDEIKILIERENIILNCVLSSKIIKKGKIIHYPKFIKEFINFLKKNKITKRFYKNILIWITPPDFNQIDKEIIRICFEELPFQELNILKEINLYQLKKNLLWINLNSDYAFLTILNKNKKEVRIWDEKNLFQITEQIDKIIEYYPNIKKIILIGNNSMIPEITIKLEKKYNKIILYYENYQDYLLTTAFQHDF